MLEQRNKMKRQARCRLGSSRQGALAGDFEFAPHLEYLGYFTSGPVCEHQITSPALFGWSSSDTVSWAK
ncbi:hypothetical protein EYF80_032646 [Liparis tanakae]|uniref:Uncharacterized protein n=1 Tax=Liparis tanakae TaxID=230148 RepID=A0A4Z2GWJ6_9TELE|nr:hypothetical protein EYF80_032646 [Liparis tanakae]